MIFFGLSTFVIVILLLNMLIAIMGDTFNKEKNVADLFLIKYHLQFIVDNWYLSSYAIKDRSDIQYLIVAFNSALQHFDKETYYDQLENKIERIYEDMEHNID